jgi:hypothetical protein
MKAGRAKNKWNVGREMEIAVSEIQETMKDEQTEFAGRQCAQDTRYRTKFACSIRVN